jgi:hypothetical protein
MPDYKMYRYDRDGYFEAEDTTHSDREIDYVNNYTPPAMHTWTAPPKYDPATEIPQWVDGKWRIVLLASLLPPVPTLEEVKADKLAELAQARWEQETGGLTLPDGTTIKTDRESQALLTGAAFSMYADPTARVEWKADKGKWVDLDSKQALMIAGAVRAHVQGCFSRERDLSEKVNACGTVEEVGGVVWG